MYDLERLIESNPNIEGGEPIFSGTEVPVKYLFDYLESGDNIDNFLTRYSTVSRAEAQAVLSYAREATLNHVSDVPIQYFFDYLESGENIDSFLARYSEVNRVEAQAVLSYAREATLSHVYVAK